jgi:hypothetical protein
MTVGICLAFLWSDGAFVHKYVHQEVLKLTHGQQVLQEEKETLGRPRLR